ncbi:MAG TPA: hypothetical protein VH277_03635 [Gemmatimonadaceae bacterium]|nr:hypothetical protein [Gemmatimonadaceae bacterium]
MSRDTTAAAARVQLEAQRRLGDAGRLRMALDMSITACALATRLNAASIPFVLTGSFANAVHGAPRATQDIDFVIDADEARLRVFVRSLPSGEYDVDEDAAIDALRHEGVFNVIDQDTGWKIDLIMRKSRAFSIEEFERRQPVDLDGVPLAVATPEGTIIAKLEWARKSGSARQLEDVASVLKLRADRLDEERILRWVTAFGLPEQWAAVQRLGAEA